jgi:uncharacterized protein (DUF362 family)
MAADTDRRDVLRRLAQAGIVLGASGIVAALGLLSPGRWSAARRAVTLPDRTVPADPSLPVGAVARGGDTATRVRAAVDAVGGIERFVRPGDRVLLKPNMSWDRRPAQGANTDPEVVAEVVRMCREAGAGSVVAADHPVNDPKRTVSRSGIGAAVREAGGEVIVPPDAGFRKILLGGAVLEQWEVLETALEADRVINLPVVKNHSSSRMTCGLKNWYGFLGGTRARLHQRLHESIADLGAAFRPTLTIVDATRVMVRGGPTGGRLDYVRDEGAIAAGTDAVALDAWAATMLDLAPSDVRYITLAEGRGLGVADPSVLGEVDAGV